MRNALALLLVAACDFSHGEAPRDGAIVDTDTAVDGAIDTTTPALWTIDSASGKAMPTDTAEWNELISARGLSVPPPDAIWNMQDTFGLLGDAVGNVMLKPNGAPSYQAVVPGWTRRAVATADGDVGSRFFNTTSPTLPDVSTTSMMLLVVYSTATTPAQTRNIVFAGCCSLSALAHVDVDPMQRLSLTVGNRVTTGTVDHGTGVIPILFQLDVTNQHQRVITDRETITSPQTGLASSRGIFIGSAGAPAPDGRWLYMAAWFGTAAEIDAIKADALIAALGW